MHYHSSTRLRRIQPAAPSPHCPAHSIRIASSTSLRGSSGGATEAISSLLNPARLVSHACRKGRDRRSSHPFGRLASHPQYACLRKGDSWPFFPSLRGLASHIQCPCLPKKGMDGCSIHPFLFSFLFPLPSRNAASSRHCASRRLVPPGQREGRVGVAIPSPPGLAPSICIPSRTGMPRTIRLPPEKEMAGCLSQPSLFRISFPSPALGGGVRGRGKTYPSISLRDALGLRRPLTRMSWSLP